MATKNQEEAVSKPQMPDQQTFELRSFFPYLVRIYYRAVSTSVTNIYMSRHGLGVHEWRAMAVLGPYGALSASEIVEQSSMDKVNVSRAIQKMRASGLLKRDIDGDDRRRSVLRLTDKGRDVYFDLVPRVLQLEENLLHGLSDKERKQLLRLMAKVRINAERLLDPTTND